MLLTIDVGNTQIYAGVYDTDNKIKCMFRKTSHGAVTSDELAVFIKQALRENGAKPEGITRIAISSVVPALLRSIVNSCVKYFNINPYVLSSSSDTGLDLSRGEAKYLGADRIADIVGARDLYPGKNLIVVDFGTANTFCAVSKEGAYLGGAISAGIGTSMNALASGTALLANVELLNPKKAAGLDTVSQLQAGLFYTGLGSIKEITGRLQEECFKEEKAMIVGTGGLARLYENEGVFDVYHADLILYGLKVCADRAK